MKKSGTENCKSDTSNDAIDLHYQYLAVVRQQQVKKQTN
jgi:hypothetical protein